jgi:hypothetical protein
MHGLWKCGCCHQDCSSANLSADDGILATLLTCSKLYCTCQLPPATEANPLCACCGAKCRKPKGHRPGIDLKH